ncbi:MAG TPA: alkaline phosphatase family protein [Candidatus Acidoferrales bacterium]|nr:alkaline phosphatase family protein [Candidatus Acidoferrales bacterium]
MKAAFACMVALVASAPAGCSPNGLGTGASGSLGSLPPVAMQARRKFSSPIRHVVIVIQENRSFDNLFAGFPNADAPTSGTMSNGQTIALQPTTLGAIDICHDYVNAIGDYDGGKMDGFDLTCTAQSKTAGTYPYSYVEHHYIRPYWRMAEEYTLADHMFPPIWGASYTGHLSLIAGTASLTPTASLINQPPGNIWGCDAAPGTNTETLNTALHTEWDGPFPCLTQFATMADTLDGAHVSWRYYAPQLSSNGLWSEFDGIKDVRYGPDWANVISPSPQFLTDVAAGKLAGVTWVVPDWLYSDHAGGGSQGPSWVAAVVNAVGQSKFWKSTAIFVVWDDWGGWYDNVPPPQIDYRGLAIRVPCIVISPYVKPHTVSHTQYEFGSILKFVEETFGLPPLGPTSAGYTDTRANSIIDSFDFTMTPRTFRHIQAPLPPSTFLNEKPSGRAPDDE